MRRFCAFSVSVRGTNSFPLTGGVVVGGGATGSAVMGPHVTYGKTRAISFPVPGLGPESAVSPLLSWLLKSPSSATTFIHSRWRRIVFERLLRGRSMTFSHFTSPGSIFIQPRQEVTPTQLGDNLSCQQSTFSCIGAYIPPRT